MSDDELQRAGERLVASVLALIALYETLPPAVQEAAKTRGQAMVEREVVA